MSKPGWLSEDGYESGWVDYEEIIESWGHEVIKTYDIGSYQGDYITLLLDDSGRFGLSVIGYGSCTGCDTLQAITPSGGSDDWSEVEEFRQQLEREIRWVGSAEEAVAYITALLDGPDGTAWYLYDEDAQDALRSFRDIISEASNY